MRSGTAATHPVRVLVSSGDARVAAALADLVNALPNFTATVAAGSVCDVQESAGAHQPDVAVIDVADGQAATALQLVRRLARRLPVVAVSDTRSLCERATAAGATSFCDKDGDTEALTTALRKAAGAIGTRCEAAPPGA